MMAALFAGGLRAHAQDATPAPAKEPTPTVNKTEAPEERPDPLKRRMLIAAGADLVIGDYREFEPLLAYLWQEQ